MKVLDVDVDYIVISKLIKSKDNSKYFIEYLDHVKRPLVLYLLLILQFYFHYVKTKITCGDKVYTNFCGLNGQEDE